VVGALAAAEGKALEETQLKLAQWLAKHGSKQPVATLSDGGALPGAKSTSGAEDFPLAAQQGGFDAPIATLPATKLKKKNKKAEPESEPEAEPAGFLARMWNEKRGLSLAAIAATVLALFGGVGAAGYMFAQPSSGAARQRRAKSETDSKLRSWPVERACCPPLAPKMHSTLRRTDAELKRC